MVGKDESDILNSCMVTAKILRSFVLQLKHFETNSRTLIMAANTLRSNSFSTACFDLESVTVKRLKNMRFNLYRCPKKCLSPSFEVYSYIEIKIQYNYYYQAKIHHNVRSTANYRIKISKHSVSVAIQRSKTKILTCLRIGKFPYVRP